MSEAPMRRLLTFLSCAGLLAAPAMAAAPTASVRPTIIIIWTVADPQSTSPDVRCLDVALRAPFEIDAPARAVRAHPEARFAIALSPSYANALACAGVDPLAAVLHATGARSDSRTRDIAMLLAAIPPLPATSAATTGGRELAALTSAAQGWLAGTSQRIPPDNLRRAAALNAAARLANAGSESGRGLLLHPPAATAALFNAAGNLLKQNVSAAERAGRDAAARGQLEFVAAPDGSPILPLLVDSGGKTMSDPSVLPLNAAADAAALIDDALDGVASLGGRRGSGLLAPFGAYDDASAQLIAARGAHYAIYSDRVLQTSQAGGSVAALRAAQASPYLIYGLQIGKKTNLPLFFWADDASRRLDALSASLPPDAFAARVTSDAGVAGTTSLDRSARVLTLRVGMGGQWAHRPDAAAVIDGVAMALSRWRATNTPSGYLAMHRTLTGAYGFAPGSALGSLDAFTALPNQGAMWAALAQARDAAGGDSAVKKAPIREPLLRAESSRWYLAPTLPMSQDRVREYVDEFRAALRAVYAAAGQRPPTVIAPMRLSSPPPPTPVPPTPATPRPSASGGYPQAL